jgi:epoxyqueuosine reductase
LTADDVKALAGEVGFDLCGIAPAESFPELGFLDEWLDRGYAGEMRYLARTARRRADVRQVVPSARSVISLGTLYNTDRPYSTEVNDPDAALISRYAWGEDYHEVIGRRTEALLERMRESAKEPFAARCYVDTGPVQERVYARHAGLGWIGKNTCLINPEQGSWFFLSEIITSLPVARCRRTAARPLRHVHALYRGVPDRCDSRAAGARRHTLPVISDHRDPGGDPRRSSGPT